MKLIIYILLIGIPALSYCQNISVETDTLDLSKNGRLTELAFWENHFYLLFETKRRNTSANFKSMKVYDLAGNFVENVFLPKEAISMPYCDLRVNNKRLYLKQEHSLSEKTFLLEKYVANFNSIKDTIINIYEDSSFIIYPNCNGEWGASTYFKSKKDNKVYEFSSSCNFNFQKVENGYLMNNGNEILIIEDPTNLYESKLNFDRSYLDKKNQGVKTFFKSEFDIYTTFKKDDKLMAIYGDSSCTYVGELNDSKLKSSYNFDKPYRFSYWFKDNNRNLQILRMFTYKSKNELGYLDGYKTLGFLLIDNGKIRIYHTK
ncbi:hypothetical protein [Aquimarina algiphila]|uniref:hypothetical protein n=1 Tax=Aquimarina algiphila TaxID=2047982 RepID=UPI00248F8132|nr:hypothetical protein [Aquimarina algiphila]